MPGGGILFPKKTGDVGYDLKIAEITTLPSRSTPMLIPCGFSMKLPKGYSALIVGRSSAISQYNIQVFTSLIDEGFIGPIFVVTRNLARQKVTIPTGTRLAQVILIKNTVVPIEETRKLPITERGVAGWGSTGR